MKTTSNVGVGVTASQLLKAAKIAERLESKVAEVAKLQDEMTALLTGRVIVGKTSSTKATSKGGGMSASQKAKIGEAMRAKWAARKASAQTQGTPAATPATTQPVTA